MKHFLYTALLDWQSIYSKVWKVLQLLSHAERYLKRLQNKLHIIKISTTSTVHCLRALI